MNEKNKVDRLVWLDAMKGVGIILIMMSHTVHIGVLFILYSGFIPLFFIASAFVYKTMDIKKRFKRLIIPYLFYGVSFILLSTIMGIPLSDNNYWGMIYGRCRIFKEGLDIAMLPRIISPLWFLPAMFSSFLFVYIRTKIKPRWGGYYDLFSVVIAIAMTYSPIIMPWSIDTCIVHGYIFLLAIRYKSLLTNVTKKKFIIACLLFGIIYVINRFPNISISCYGRFNALSIPLYMAIGFLESYIIICISKWLSPFSFFIPIVYCGRTSLRLMCIHMFIICVISLYGEKFHLNNIICLTLSLSIVFFLNYILQHFWDKYRNKFLILKYL